MKVTVGTQTTDAPEWWTVTDIAEHLGIGEPTWRGYVSRRFAPPPDDPGDPTAHPKRRIPRWRPDTIHAWQATRRGRGTRRKTATEGDTQ